MTHECLSYGHRGTNYNPLDYAQRYTYTGGPSHFSGNSDLAYDAIADKALTATDYEEMQKYVREADLYVSKLHLLIWLILFFSFTFYQPWFKRGLNGQHNFGGGQYLTHYAWL